jgi:20S proteasome subunit beta 7
VSQRIGAMIPVRVSHNPSIGPGVVPAGVDPAYDAQYANHKGPTAHVGANGHGRPFSVAPGPITHTQ